MCERFFVFTQLRIKIMCLISHQKSNGSLLKSFKNFERVLNFVLAPTRRAAAWRAE
jgi:hypothetical protein